jgi:hypothetical protein
VTDDIKKASILSAVRLTIAIIGAVAASLGHHIEPGVLQTLDIASGSFLVAVSAAWSQWNVRQIELATKAREVVAVRVGQTIADGTAGPTALAPASEVPALIKIIAPKLPPTDPLPNPLVEH